ncbi:MAG: sn-glycerol-3-phosphate import ATP-binding protein UgpC [Gammaproteobacteria bacterium]|nr:sn-glycerol-3-phosphate import ATP-binding protein UgpC [Gammaproteobacteria bacterium]
MADISLTNLSKTYPNGFKAIHDIDLEIEHGEFVVLVGPSGCGKSTLLRMIAGLETVTDGEIKIAGQRVNEREPAERDIAMVFQNYALYPHMTVYNNMAYGLRNKGTARDEIERRVQEAAKLLELSELLDRKPRQLSGGQRQRVAMGRAIVRDPVVFLFDEPLSNLDAKLRVQMRLEIKRLQRRLGTTAVYVTHDQVEAMTMADKLVVMNAGVAEQIGNPMSVYEQPATQFVAGFIGSPAMNFLPAKLEDNGKAVQIENGPLLTLASKVNSSGSNRSIVVGIRPEHLVPTPEGAIGFAIEMIEALGAESLVHGLLPGNNGVNGVDITLRIDAATAIPSESEIRLHVSTDRLHVFDANTGERLN